MLFLSTAFIRINFPIVRETASLSEPAHVVQDEVCVEVTSALNKGLGGPSGGYRSLSRGLFDSIVLMCNRLRCIQLSYSHTRHRNLVTGEDEEISE